MDSKQRYLEKIRQLGILKKEKDMPKRFAVGQIEESIKKSGREGFEPVSSVYASKLYQKSKEKPSVEKDVQNLFRGTPFTPDSSVEMEDKALEKIYYDQDIDPSKKEKLLKALRERMRTS